MSSPFVINESEFDGYFCEIQFDKEDEPTLLFIADKDFESLKELAKNSETSWEDFRNELMELLEHSGHDQDHHLSEETTKEIKRIIQER